MAFDKSTKFVSLEHSDRIWHFIDAKNLSLGRLARLSSVLLRGKHKPSFAPSVDVGDYVVILNAELISMTNGKMHKEPFRWHTNYPGGLKEVSRHHLAKKGAAERFIRQCIKNMMPKGPLANTQLSRLKIVNGETHTHQAQFAGFLDVTKYDLLIKLED